MTKEVEENTKYAIENGNKQTARHFSLVLNKGVNESTVRSIIKPSYVKRQCLDESFSVCARTVRPKSPRGRPLKLVFYDEQVKDYLQNRQP